MTNDHKSDSNLPAEWWGTAGAGLLITCPEDGTILLLQRSEKVDQPFTWGNPGGAVGADGWYVDGEYVGGRESEHEPGSFDEAAFWAGAMRETREELKTLPEFCHEIGHTIFRSGDFVYKTFIMAINAAEKSRWLPTIELNWENTDFDWYTLDGLPNDLHFGITYVLNHCDLAAHFHDHQRAGDAIQYRIS